MESPAVNVCLKELRPHRLSGRLITVRTDGDLADGCVQEGCGVEEDYQKAERRIPKNLGVPAGDGLVGLP